MDYVTFIALDNSPGKKDIVEQVTPQTLSRLVVPLQIFEERLAHSLLGNLKGRMVSSSVHLHEKGKVVPLLY